MAAAVRKRRPSLLVSKGDYLTDEKRLVCVHRVMKNGELLVEEGDSDAENPALTSIPAAALAAGTWRRLELLVLESSDG